VIEGTKPEVGKTYESRVTHRLATSREGVPPTKYPLPREYHLHRLLYVREVNEAAGDGRQVVGTISIVPAVRPDEEPVTDDYSTSLEIFAETWTPVEKDTYYALRRTSQGITPTLTEVEQ
jgi:hypothetical protein